MTLIETEVIEALGRDQDLPLGSSVLHVEVDDETERQLVLNLSLPE